jgi:hypothetical protein
MDPQESPIPLAKSSMASANLADLLDRPDVHRMLVGDYAGPYSLGVTELSGPSKIPALRLRFQGDPVHVPSCITVDGRNIPIVVEGGFSAPTPF